MEGFSGKGQNTLDKYFYVPPAKKEQNKSKEGQVICPGLVFFKGGLNRDDQIQLASYAEQVRDGFYDIAENGERKLNSATSRGRIYNAIDKYPDYLPLLDTCNRFAKLANEMDESMPEMNPSHLLLLQYTGTRGMGWHSDNGANDGDNDHPIVSISIGNACEFGYKLGQSTHYVRLESGDVLVWGGSQRMMKHSIKCVYAKTSPSYLPVSDVRLNFTFRDAPTVRGKEDQFKYYRPGDQYTKKK